MADTARVPLGGPRVGVVTITRDRRPELLHALGMLLSLPERPPVVVVDNGSRDGSARAVRSAHPRVDVVSLAENIGSAGRAVGARRLDTPYVAFSDDDSWWAPGALSTAARCLDAHPRLAVVAARILVGAGERLDPVCEQMAHSPLPDRGDLPGPRVLGFLACGAVVRRTAFLTAGGFDVHFGVGGEEELLALDLVTSGWDLAYVDAVVAHHHPSPSRDPAGRARGAVRNRLWVAWLRRPAGGALRVTARAARRAVRDPHARAGLVEAVRGGGWVWPRRRVVPDRVERLVRRLEVP
ncbi:MAG: glycosyltransferase [Actinobacteria bacterium]|nr:glycosyltransferase [Actinomycetota bacterium]